MPTVDPPSTGPLGTSNTARPCCGVTFRVSAAESDAVIRGYAGKYGYNRDQLLRAAEANCAIGALRHTVCRVWRRAHVTRLWFASIFYAGALSFDGDKTAIGEQKDRLPAQELTIRC